MSGNFGYLGGETLKLNCGTIIETVDGSFLNHPIIRERIKHIEDMSVTFSNNNSHDNPKSSPSGISENKYFWEGKGVTYAHGICIKKYNENK